MVGIRSQWDEICDGLNGRPACRSEDRTLTSVKLRVLSRALRCAGRSPCPSDDACSSSLAFAAPSMTLLVTERAFEVFHTSSNRVVANRYQSPFTGFRSPSKSPSINCAIRIALIVNLVSSVPLLWHHNRVSTPTSSKALRFGEPLPGDSSCSAPAVSHDFDGLLHTMLAGLLRPATGHGVDCVSRLALPRASLSPK